MRLVPDRELGLRADETGQDRDIGEQQALVAETRLGGVSAYSLQDDISGDAAFAPLVEGARLAGFPVTGAETVSLGRASEAGTPDRRP